MRLLLISSLFLFSCTRTHEIELIENPTGESSSLSRLFTDNNGSIFMSWVEQKNDTATLFYSEFENELWSSPTLIASSDEWFVNWADFPSLITLNGEPIAAHWLKKIPGGTYSYNVEVLSFDLNESFVPHTDGTATEHGFVSMNPVSDSSFYTIWLDGRNMAGGHGHEDMNHGEIGNLDNAMTLRGALISTGNIVLQEHEIDNAVCECCNTSLLSTPGGLIAAYRNRTENEIRDIYISRYENSSWTKGVPVFNDNWEIGGCPVNGPMLSGAGDNIAVGWFTGAGDIPKVKLSFSEDGGKSFHEPIFVDVEAPLGRVDIEMMDSESAWISWIARDGDKGELKLKHIKKNGDTLQQFTITEIDPSRRTGFPQLTKMNNQLMLSWTDISGENPSIKTAIIR